MKACQPYNEGKVQESSHHVEFRDIHVVLSNYSTLVIILLSSRVQIYRLIGTYFVAACA